MSPPKSTPFTLPFIASKSSNSPTSSTSKYESTLPTTRPILTHLNADTTWLLLIPYPSNFPSKSNRKFYRILLDPWLSGPQSDYFTWFSTQWHAFDPSISSIKELEEFIENIDPGKSSDENQDTKEKIIDLVIVSHEFTDHCHKETLLELDKDTVIFAPDKARALIESWEHFDKVHETIKFKEEIIEGDWRDPVHNAYMKGLLPEWLGISRIESPGNALYYHSAVMITFPNLQNESEEEAVLYTPHGVDFPALEILPKATPKIKPLVLLHGLDDIQVGWISYKQLNLGAINGVKCVTSSGGAKYWIGTHDERKVAGGIVGRMLKRTTFTVKDVIEEEMERIGGEDLRGRYIEVGNGETLVLE